MPIKSPKFTALHQRKSFFPREIQIFRTFFELHLDKYILLKIRNYNKMKGLNDQVIKNVKNHVSARWDSNPQPSGPKPDSLPLRHGHKAVVFIMI